MSGSTNLQDATFLPIPALNDCELYAEQAANAAVRQRIAADALAAEGVGMWPIPPLPAPGPAPGDDEIGVMRTFRSSSRSSMALPSWPPLSLRQLPVSPRVAKKHAAHIKGAVAARLRAAGAAVSAGVGALRDPAALGTRVGKAADALRKGVMAALGMTSITPRKGSGGKGGSLAPPAAPPTKFQLRGSALQKGPTADASDDPPAGHGKDSNLIH